MKLKIVTPISILVISIFSYSVMPKSYAIAELKFLSKTNFDTSRGNYGQHIEIKHSIIESDQLQIVSVDDRDIINNAGYSRTDIFMILGEYLCFRGDTSVSNKKFIFKGSQSMMHINDIEGFTIQIEALYSFTRMLTIGYPPIKPMIINRNTGENLNSNPEAIKEVFEIYEKWYRKNLRNGFKEIKLPLSNSKYCWSDEDMGKYLKPFL